MTYQNAFVSESKQLRSKGQQLSQLHQIYKALGLVTTGVSGLALISSGGALLPLIAGLVAYGGSVLSENQRTRKLKPLPWVSNDLTAIASGALHQETQPTLGTQAHHYLDPEDKALFYLTNFQGHRLTQLAEQMEPDQFEHILTNLVDHLVTAHEPALNHPELLGQALKTDFFESAIANLPKAASQVVGAKTRLTALDALSNSPTRLAMLRSAEARTGQGDLETQPTDPAPGPKQAYLPGLLSIKLKSTLLLGAPRTGKGYAMAKAIELLPDSVDLWGIDPKNDPTEDHYWTRFPKNQLVRFDCTEADPIAVANWCISLFDRFSESNSTAERPKLLIIDEAAPGLSSCELSKFQLEKEDHDLAGWFKALMLKCARLASVGPSKGKFVWILSQSSTGADLGISNGNKGGYRIVAVGHQDTPPTWYDSIASSLKIGKPSADVLATGYIQNDGTGWYPARPFKLKSTNHLADHNALPGELADDDVESQIVSEEPSTKGLTNWEAAKAKMQSVNSPLLPLVEWFDSRDEAVFHLSFLRENGKLRNTVGNCEYFEGNNQRDRVESAVMILVNDGLLNLDGESIFNLNK